jgi:hypothetical protein
MQKRFRITYGPFPQSPSTTASDIFIFAEDAAEAKKLFEQRYPAWNFIHADEEL